MQSLLILPEKAGGGGSIPSLATMFSRNLALPVAPFSSHSVPTLGVRSRRAERIEEVHAGKVLFVVRNDNAVVRLPDRRNDDVESTPRSYCVRALGHETCPDECVMEQLHHWLQAQFAERKTERNSGLGKAITYLLRHWKALTLFLRKAGTPLDNNIVERALKRAVLHRKNALFYRTLNGAEVGDLFMSLIHTCQLCGANSFDYLTELQRHAQKLAANPAGWMPWNYRETLERIVSL